MRNNEPVTNQLRDYRESQKIVSTTDTKGVIRDVNDDFIDISGFEKDELIGQAHNLVRHPSMPQTAFSELWEHNKSRKPWMGIVKNRCKNGDHYWVDAFVTPIFEDGQVVGYQSVRQKPADELIRRAEKIYQGNINPVEALADKWQSIKLSYKLFLSFTVVTAVALFLSMWVSHFIAPLIFLLVANSIVSYLLANPWERFTEETKSIFDSELARKIYTHRSDELGQLQLTIKFLRSQQDTILYRTENVAGNVQTTAYDAHEVSEKTVNEINVLYKEVEQAVSATRKMSVSIQDVAENASSTSDAAAESKGNVSKGQSILHDTKQAIEDLVVAVNQSSEIIESLSENSTQIGSVVDVISGIAEQTNLLALNAAIEAARAGEQGRGFAVVADEVRALAAKTQESTGQISDMISVLQQGTTSAVNSISSSHEQVNLGVTNIQNLDNQFETILSNVNSISDRCTQIAVATEQQSAVAEDINQNIDRINEVGKNTIESTRAVNQNNETLMDISASMKGMIKQFRG